MTGRRPEDRIRIGIVDYGMGNRRSVEKALEHVGASVIVTGEHDALSGCSGLVIPGVGAFPRAMSNLHQLGLVEPLQGLAGRGTPILGICLGMQLLFDGSEEIEPTPGLGLLPGQVTWLKAEQRLPHIGWNEVRFERPSRLTEGLPPAGVPFYHVHSLAARPERAPDTVGTTEYGERFATIVENGNVAGVQFHPEKSSGHGLRLLANFVSRCGDRQQGKVGLAAPA
jgi:glutamine amidotransferase